MRKRFKFDQKYRASFLKNEFISRLLKYSNCCHTTNILLNDNSAEKEAANIFMEGWKNKSFKFSKSKSFKWNSRIRNFCIVSGRGRGLSKNYFSVARSSFKHLQSIGLIPGVYKST